jgi:hypothetical protein
MPITCCAQARDNRRIRDVLQRDVIGARVAVHDDVSHEVERAVVAVGVSDPPRAEVSNLARARADLLTLAEKLD